jgi:hypothetical protein
MTKPYLLTLSLDYIDFDSAYLIDDGEYLNIFVFNYIKEEFYYELFGVNSYEAAIELHLDSLDESNGNDLNVRIVNIINQLRKENKGLTQPLRLSFME